MFRKGSFALATVHCDDMQPCSSNFNFLSWTSFGQVEMYFVCKKWSGQTKLGQHYFSQTDFTPDQSFRYSTTEVFLFEKYVLRQIFWDSSLCPQFRVDQNFVHKYLSEKKWVPEHFYRTVQNIQGTKLFWLHRLDNIR